jgi:hypothetical protein
MTTRIWLVPVMALASATLVPAQDGNVSGPTTGFVFDGAAHRLRPLLGVPGASLMGDPVASDVDLASAAIAPGQDLAIASTGDGGLHVFRLSNGSLRERSVEGVSVVPERVVYSPSGTAAALYAARKAQILTGLPDAPTVAGTLDLEATPSSLALSDDGGYILFTAGGSLQLQSAGGRRKLMDAADGAIAAFKAGGLDAAALDSAGVGLVLFRDLAGSSQQTVVASPDDSTASPVGLAFSSNGRRLFVASASARAVASFDLQTGDRASVACSCALTGLAAMGNLLRLNELGTDPLWLLDAGAEELRIVFVPALAPAVN